MLEPYWSSSCSSLYVGDATVVLRSLPRAAAHCVVTSPPYYGLRDYAGHPAQLGQESTPGAYIDALRQVLSEVVRVLRPDGTVWLNLGDVYSGRANAGSSVDRHTGRGHRTGVVAKARLNTPGTARYKSLLLMPSRVALALTEDGWLVRNDIVWHKPNAMPESVTDRFSTRYEHLFLLARRPSYYFDLDASKVTAGNRRGGNREKAAYAAGVGTEKATRRFGGNPGSTLASKEFETRNPGDVWSIATRRTAAAHFAMYPPEIPTRCIAAGSPAGGLVLDPFSGAATTGVAAQALGRRYIGIDLNCAYHDIAIRRLSPP